MSSRLLISLIVASGLGLAGGASLSWWWHTAGLGQSATVDASTTPLPSSASDTSQPTVTPATSAKLSARFAAAFAEAKQGGARGAWLVALAQWLETDAPAAWEAAKATGDREVRHAALRLWARLDPKAACAAAGKDELWLVVEANPRGALTYGSEEVLAERVGKGSGRFSVPALAALAREAPEKFRRWAEQADNTPRRAWLSGVAGYLARHHPEQALAWANDPQTTPRRRNIILAETIPELAAIDPERARQAMEELTASKDRDPEDRRFIEPWIKTLERLDTGDSPQLAGWLNRTTWSQEKGTAVSRFLGNVFDQDPDRAFELAAAIRFDGPAEGWFDDSRRLATTPPSHLLETLSAAPASPLRDDLTTEVFQRWLGMESAAAITAWEQYRIDPSRDPVRLEAQAKKLREHLSLRHLDTAVALLGTPAGDALGLSHAEIMREVATREPARLGELWDKARTPAERAEATTSVAQSWAEFDRPAALAWALELPPENFQSEALGAVMRAWHNEDPGQLQRWLAVLPDTEARGWAQAALEQALSSRDQNSPSR